MTRRQRIALAGAVVALTLLARELTLLDLSLYLTRSMTDFSRSCASYPVAIPLTADDRKLYDTGKRSELPQFPGFVLTYVEVRHRPWGRWIPLIKIGTTQISRRFLVTENGKHRLSGASEAKVSLRAFGPMPARKYAEMAESAANRDFMAWLEEHIKKAQASRTAAAPSAP